MLRINELVELIIVVEDKDINELLVAIANAEDSVFEAVVVATPVSMEVICGSLGRNTA